VGREPWSAADAPVGLLRARAEPDQGSSAGEGARPKKTLYRGFQRD
jgi:hypothetical protein